MKKFVFLLSVVCLFALSAFAQTPNFAGEWNLDKSKSKLSEQQTASIESRTITVEQNDKEIKATTATKRNAPAGGQGGPPPGGGGMGGGRGMMGGGGDGTSTYSLDGKEVVTERETQMGKIPTKTIAKIKDGKFHVESSTTFNTPNGEMTMTNKSVWELSADGKTLTVKTTQSGRNGDTTTEWVYTKKS